MTLAARIKEAIGDMKPVDVAKATNNSASAVTQWMNGETKTLRGETVALLELKTGYRASWIILGKGPKKCDDGNSGNVLQLPNQGIPYALSILSQAVAASDRRGDDMLLGALTSFGKDPSNQETLDLLARIIGGKSAEAVNVKTA